MPPFVLALGTLSRVASRVFHFAPSVFCLALDLLGCTFSLGFAVTSPFADLAFDASSRVIQFAFHSILIHHFTSPGFKTLVISGGCQNVTPLHQPSNLPSHQLRVLNDCSSA